MNTIRPNKMTKSDFNTNSIASSKSKYISEPLLESMVEDGERKYRAPALEKGLDILELLAESPSLLTTTQMAQALDRSVSELFRMVLALEYRGYITQVKDGREGYQLTNKLFTLGISQYSSKTLLEVALPELKSLARELGQSCHMLVSSGDQVVVVARQESPMDLGFAVRVGYRQPLVDTHSGALLYGFASPDTQETWRSLLSGKVQPDRLERFLAKARKGVEQGYLEIANDFVDGVTDICVPVHGPLGAFAVVVVPFIHIKSQTIAPDWALVRLLRAAEKISQALME